MRPLPVAALLALLLAPAHARATPESDRVFEEGRERQRAGDLAAARSAYLDAWRLEPSYYVAGNLGQVELALGLHRDAAEHLAQALTFPVAPGARSALQSALEQATREVVTLELPGAPEGARVRGAEGEVMVVGAGQARPRAFLRPGRHRLALRRGDQVVALRDVDASAGQVVTVTVAWDAPEPERGDAQSPPAPRPPHEARPAPRRDADDSSALRVPALVGGGALAALSLGAGVVFELRRSAAEDEVQARKLVVARELGRNCATPSESPSCGALARAVERERGARTLAVVSLAAGGVTALATVAAALLWAPPAAGSGARTGVPWRASVDAGSGALGVRVAGAF